MGVWITEECGQKLINIQPFLGDDQIEAIQDQILDNLQEAENLVFSTTFS